MSTILSNRRNLMAVAVLSIGVVLSACSSNTFKGAAIGAAGGATAGLFTGDVGRGAAVGAASGAAAGFVSGLF